MSAISPLIQLPIEDDIWVDPNSVMMVGVKNGVVVIYFYGDRPVLTIKADKDTSLEVMARAIVADVNNYRRYVTAVPLTGRIG